MFIDSLESRRLMSVSVNVDANGVLNINGTDGNELVGVQQYAAEDGSTRVSVFAADSYTLDEVGNPLVEPTIFEDFGSVTSIRINLNGGDDFVFLDTQTLGALVNTGAGNDIINVNTFAPEGGGVHTGFTAIVAGDGNDTVFSNGGSNLAILGGAGADNITLAGADGTPIVDGGDDNDTIVVTFGNGGIILGGAGDDQIDFQETGVGGTFGGLAFGGAGNDTIHVLLSNAIIAFGGNGNDSLTNEGSTDITLYGDAGSDELTVLGADATGILYGGSGSDLFHLGSQYVTVVGGQGSDTVQIEADGISVSQLFSIEKIQIVDTTTGAIA